MQLKDATLLVVDDEVELVEIFKEWFEREGCRVHTAENGERALAIAAASHIDAVVSDVRMPVLDGIGLARGLKEHRAYVPKIVFISGFSDISDRDCFDLGVEAMVSKPVKRLALVAVVRRSLSDRDMVWRERPALEPLTKLEAVFPSLTVARDQGLIAFGRGGVCVRSTLPVKVNDPIALHLDFEAERLALVGQGIVRWIDPRDQQIGIEIVHVDDAHRAWVAGLSEANEAACFIPRSSSPQGA